MDEIKRLTAAQCVLLAVHLASTANVAALRSLSSSRPDAFSSQLLLRILLTYLPESVDPSLYISYVHEIATHTSPDPLDAEPSSAPIDAVALASLPKPAQAAKRVKKLHLLALEPLASSSKATSQQKNGQDNGDDEFEGDKQDAEARAALSSFVVQRARRIDAETGLLNLVPARLTALLIAGGAHFVKGAHPETAWSTALRDASKHESPNAGWPEAAMAGALGFRLCGPRSYDGEVVDLPSFGAGRAELNADHIDRSLKLYAMTLNLTLAAAMLVALVLWRLA